MPYRMRHERAAGISIYRTIEIMKKELVLPWYLSGLVVSVLMTAGSFAGICLAGSGIGILSAFLVILICFMACFKLSLLVEKKHEITVDAKNRYVA